jgi:hypothetical protein
MTPQVYLFVTSAKRFFKHHHPVIFISFIGILLAAAVAMLYWVLVIGFSNEGTNVTNIGSFDQKTVDKIKNLHNSSDPNGSPLVLPSPRSNPFVE